MALCEQYYVKQGWRPPSDMVYKKALKPLSRKVGHPSTKIWDAEDLSSGDEPNRKANQWAIGLQHIRRIATHNGSEVAKLVQET